MHIEINGTDVYAIVGGLAFASAGWPAAIAVSRGAPCPAILARTALLIVIGCFSLFFYLLEMHGWDPLIGLTYGVEVTARLVILFVYVWRNPA